MISLLVVDDSSLNHKLALDILESHKIMVRVKSLKSASSALEALKTTKFDILLLDIVMPGMSGVELLEVLNEEELLGDMKVVMYSSLSDRAVLKRCFELGATDFINKPFDEVEFVSRIQAAINEQTIKKRYRSSIELLSKRNDELTEVHQQLIETQHKVVQQEQMASVGYLAAGIAHEINNPLGFIKNNIQVLDKYVNQLIFAVKSFNSYENNVQTLNNAGVDLEWIESDTESLIKETQEGISRVAEIVNSLRGFSGIDELEAGNEYCISQHCKDMLNLINVDIDGQIEVITDLRCEVCLVLNGNKLNMAILNIVKNAIYALKSSTAQRKKELHIETWNDEESIYCKIYDNGVGMTKEVQQRVCSPFYTSKAVGEGMGLGLTVAYDVVVKQLGGSLDITSEEGAWTEVVLKIPMRR